MCPDAAEGGGDLGEPDALKAVGDGGWVDDASAQIGPDDLGNDGRERRRGGREADDPTVGSSETGVEPHVIEYLKTPPTRALLVQLLARAGLTVRDVLREKGTPYAELGLVDASLTDDALLDAIEAHPILLNRPLVVTPKGVRLCRRPRPYWTCCQRRRVSS